MTDRTEPLGVEGGWSAVFWRYHSRVEVDGFDTPDAALGFLKYGEDEGTLSSEAILDPTGAVALDKGGISEAYSRDLTFAAALSSRPTGGRG